MNIVFFGSSHFSIPSLEVLTKSGHRISCVVTQPDRRQGRGLRYASTPVKLLAGSFGFNLYQPEGINTQESFEVLKTQKADLFVVIAYGQILSREILNLPGLFSLNVHASLLPQYRGAAPINWAIINGEQATGVTTIKMTEKMDSGPIILQAGMAISTGDTALTLEEKLAKQGAAVLLDSIKLIEDKQVSFLPQDESKISFAPKLKKEDGLINWQKKSEEIYNLVKGCLDWPVAFTYYRGQRLKIYSARVDGRKPNMDSLLPGEILEVTPQTITVATGEGNLLIDKVQLEARRIMTAGEFLSGHRISRGEKLG